MLVCARVVPSTCVSSAKGPCVSSACVAFVSPNIVSSAVSYIVVSLAMLELRLRRKSFTVRWYFCSILAHSLSFTSCNTNINSLAPGKFEWDHREIIFKFVFAIDGWGSSCEIAQWISLDLTNVKLILVQVMAWCNCQAINRANVDPDLHPHMASLGHNKVAFNSLVPGKCSSNSKYQSSRKTFLATSPVRLVTDQAH